MADLLGFQFQTSGIDSFEKFSWVYIDGFREYPFAVSLDFLSWIYTLLILLTAICLTLIPRNRELAEQSEPASCTVQEFQTWSLIGGILS